MCRGVPGGPGGSKKNSVPGGLVKKINFRGKKNSDLLPEGFKVLLPDRAEKEDFLSRKILDILNVNGYLLVKTPLLEYEESISISKNLQFKSINHEPFILTQHFAVEDKLIDI